MVRLFLLFLAEQRQGTREASSEQKLRTSNDFPASALLEE